MTRELERLGPDGMDYLVLGLDAPGFADLAPRQRALAYLLSRAAIAGDRIYTDQCHRHALEIQLMMEEIHVHAEGLPAEVKEAVLDYLKYLWINHGQYDADHHGKFTPKRLTPGMLAVAAPHAVSRGARFGMRHGERLDGKLARLGPHIFDPEVEPIQTNQKEGEDIVASSAVNLYDRGVTEAMLQALPPAWQERLNVRFAFRDGQAVPEVYRIGGRYGQDLAAVAFFLEKALPLAEGPEQRAGLEALLEHYRTGEEEPFRRHAIAWLGSDTIVDYLNGFIEQYNDPRGVIGQFEGNASFVSDSTLIGRLADSAGYFEQRMPWPDRYKRQCLDRPVARVVNVLVETGDAGPVSPAAYNLPNDAALRRDHGSKNVVLRNIEDARSPQVQEAMYGEFYLPEFRDLIRRHHDEGRKWLVYMHEVIGHGSGQPEPGLTADPRTLIGRSYSALEECRADLVALHHVADEKLVQIGAFPAERHADIVMAMYVGYLQGHLTRYRSIPEPIVREAHRRGEELVLQWLARGGPEGRADYGVAIVQHDGDYFVELRDLDKARAGVAQILERLQTIKSRGDEGAATELFERFGTHLDPAIHRNIVQRAERLRIPRMTAFVFPRLEPVIERGEVVDARLHEDEDLVAQQLRFRRERFQASLS
ncbi:MAG: dipeptidyl-peptidase 3 family protein [Candidatus Polarisedimenticolia bacterium]